MNVQIPVTKMIEDLDYIIKTARSSIESKDPQSFETLAATLETIRNATFTKATILQMVNNMK